MIGTMTRAYAAAVADEAAMRRLTVTLAAAGPVDVDALHRLVDAIATQTDVPRPTVIASLADAALRPLTGLDTSLARVGVLTPRSWWRRAGHPTPWGGKHRRGWR